MLSPESTEVLWMCIISPLVWSSIVDVLPVLLADLREVGAPCWFMGQTWLEKGPSVSEQLLGGTVCFIRQWSRQPLLGRPPVRKLTCAGDRSILLFAISHIQMTSLSVCHFCHCHYRNDKCLQGLANATMSEITSHTTCMYSVVPSLSLPKHALFFLCWISHCICTQVDIIRK